MYILYFLIRAGAPPPSFGQCPKENIFFKGGVPLSPSLSHVYQQQNFPALTISSSGLGTFCPATKRPRAYVVPGRYMSWDALSRDKMSPDLFSTSIQRLISGKASAVHITSFELETQAADSHFC